MPSESCRYLEVGRGLNVGVIEVSMRLEPHLLTPAVVPCWRVGGALGLNSSLDTRIHQKVLTMVSRSRRWGYFFRGWGALMRVSRAVS